MELLEKGRVRFWLQAEGMSANGKVEYIFNDNVLPQSEVRERHQPLLIIIIIINN